MNYITVLNSFNNSHSFRQVTAVAPKTAAVTTAAVAGAVAAAVVRATMATKLTEQLVEAAPNLTKMPKILKIAKKKWRYNI